MSKSNLVVTQHYSFNVSARFLRDMYALFQKCDMINRYDHYDYSEREVTLSCAFNAAVDELLHLLPIVRQIWDRASWIEDPLPSYGEISTESPGLIFVLCALSKIDFLNVVKASEWSVLHEVVL